MSENLPLFWLIAGIILVFLEFALPSFVVIFFGTSAILVGVLGYLGILNSLESQLIVFAVLSIAQLAILRKWLQSVFKGDEADLVDDELKGQRVVVVESFTNGHGRVQFRGAGWGAESSDALSEGEEGFIVSQSGMKLRVSKNKPDSNSV